MRGLVSPALAATCLLIPPPASAQSPTPASRVWLSLGAGSASVPTGHGYNVNGALNISSGAALIELGAAAAARGGPLADSTMFIFSGAALAGLRTPGSAFFGTGAIGISGAKRSDSYRPCEACSSSDTNDPFVRALAWDLGVHATAWVAGLGLHAFGLSRTRRSNYAALALSAEVGWFGRW